MKIIADCFPVMLEKNKMSLLLNCPPFSSELTRGFMVRKDRMLSRKSLLLQNISLPKPKNAAAVHERTQKEIQTVALNCGLPSHLLCKDLTSGEVGVG